MANPVESGSRRGSDDLALRPVKVQPRAKVQTPTPSRRFWIGVTDDAPFDSDSRGGVAFQKWGGYPEFDEKTGKPTNSPPAGTVVELTETQVKLIRERVENIVLRVVRFEGDRSSGPRKEYVSERIFLGSSPKYVPQPNDVPLGYFLYMVPVGEKMAHDWRASTPERMCDERSMAVIAAGAAEKPSLLGAAAG